MSSHENSVGPIGLKAIEGLVNSGQSLLSSCSPSDAVLLQDLNAANTVQLLATVTHYNIVNL